jgi:hypothetical protein
MFVVTLILVFAFEGWLGPENLAGRAVPPTWSSSVSILKEIPPPLPVILKLHDALVSFSSRKLSTSSWLLRNSSCSARFSESMDSVCTVTILLQHYYAQRP